MKSSFIELIRSAFGPKDKKFRRRLTIFLICLVISVIIWFSIKLANDYDTVIDMKVVFTDLPRNKIITGCSDSTLSVEIMDKGSDLFRLQYIRKSTAAAISLKNLSLLNKDGVYSGIIIPSTQIDEIEEEQGLLGKILSIRPDTIYLTLENQKSKKVPVRAYMMLGFEKQYMAYGNVRFEPDSVMVKGPARQIERLEVANLGIIDLKGLNNSVAFEKRFERDTSNRHLEYSPNIIKVIIPVEKYTESELESDIHVTNNKDLKVKIFPDKVKVVYDVALKDFSKVEPGMFNIVADFTGVDINRDDKVKLKIENYPDFIEINRIEPEKAEFIIIK